MEPAHYPKNGLILRNSSTVEPEYTKIHLAEQKNDILLTEDSDKKSHPPNHHHYSPWPGPASERALRPLSKRRQQQNAAHPLKMSTNHCALKSSHWYLQGPCYNSDANHDCCWAKLGSIPVLLRNRKKRVQLDLSATKNNLHQILHKLSLRISLLICLTCLIWYSIQLGQFIYGTHWTYTLDLVIRQGSQWPFCEC